MSRRQPGTMTAYSPGARGGSHSREMNGPANWRLPSVITCSPSVSLTGLAIRVLDGAHLHLGFGLGRNRIQFARLGGRLLRVGGAHGAQVVGRLEAANPSELVGVVQLLARGARHIDIERLRLVDPFLAPRGRFHQPLRLDLEGRGIEAAQPRRGTVDAGE